MADIAEKFKMVAGSTLPFLRNFVPSEDGESFMYRDLKLGGLNIDAVNKFIEEAKESAELDLSVNNLQDVKPLDQMVNLVRIDLSNNKVKALTPFCNEENFPKLKWLNVSLNKLTEVPPIKCPKLEFLDIS